MEITKDEDNLKKDRTIGRPVDLVKRLKVSKPTLLKVLKTLTPCAVTQQSRWFKIADVARELKKRRMIGPNTKPDIEISKKDAQIQQILAMTRLKELEIAEREKTLVSVVEVGRTAERFIIGIKKILLTFPDRYAVQCENRSAGHVKKILQGGIDEVLNELASFDPCGDGSLSSEDADEHEVIPTAGTNDGGHMGEEVPPPILGVVSDGGEVATEQSTLPEGSDGGDIRPGTGGDSLGGGVPGGEN